MSYLHKIAFGFRKKLPPILQTEAAECGLACLCAIAGYHGLHIDLRAMRAKYSVSLKGTDLSMLIKIAHRMQLGTRPLKLALSELAQLKMPCVLHWNFNHFVVLKQVRSKTIVIHDPAQGMREISLAEASEAFTGVALEVWPDVGFVRTKTTAPVKLRQLIGKVSGIVPSFVQVLTLAFALEILALANPFFLQWIIDDVVVRSDTNLLTTMAIGFGVLMLINQAISGIRTWVLIYIGTSFNIQWRANVFTHLLRLPVSYFGNRHIGDVVSRFESVSHIQSTLTSSFLSAILDGVMTFATLAMMFIYSPVLAWIAVAAMLLYIFGRCLWYRPLRAATEQELIHSAKQESHFLESIRGVKAIKLFSCQDERRSSWLNLFIKQINAGLRTEKLGLFYQQLNGFLFGIENILILWLGAKLVIDGQFTVGVLIAFNSYKMQFANRVTNLVDNFFKVKMLQVHAERLSDIVLTEPEPLVERAATTDRVVKEASIEVIGVHYRYAEHEPEVLHDIHFRIDTGEAVAIVGPSGGGKSTLINVLTGSLSPQKGIIKIGNINVAHLGIENWRQCIGTVMQDDVLFAGSIADNISFFNSMLDHAWIVECAQSAAVHEDIMAMPMQYNTLVGDMGTVLSGGQKQRILLARALYKRPGILVLDEATSHLDIAREQQVNSAIRSMNMTRIIVAHRPETIFSADRVILIDQGKVMIDGPIDQVAERMGLRPSVYGS